MKWGIVMFSNLIVLALNNLLYFALHLETNGVFPKPLSAKEEAEYFEKMANGDRTARNKLIEHNLRLVAHIIKKYYSNSKEQDDLISIGTIGLIKAVSTFDYKKGTRFATYASKCIENVILSQWLQIPKMSRKVLLLGQNRLNGGHFLVLMRRSMYCIGYITCDCSTLPFTF